MLRRGFRPPRLGAEVVAMISLASGVWTLLSDDLSSVIIGQSIKTSIYCSLSCIRSFFSEGDKLSLMKMGLGWPYLQDLPKSLYPQWEARVVQSAYPKEYLSV